MPPWRMAAPMWTDVVQAISAVSVPIVIAILAYILTRTQSRNDELLKVRLDYYKALTPDLNRLMCYMTFIGTWRDQSPPEVVGIKRRLDETFFCAAPLFSPDVLKAYIALMDKSFSTFGNWGTDARICSSAYRRRQSWQANSPWKREWDHYFILDDGSVIAAEDLRRYRETYDALVAALVRDLNVTRSRARYTTDEVALNAHAPKRTDITGRNLANNRGR